MLAVSGSPSGSLQAIATSPVVSSAVVRVRSEQTGRSFAAPTSIDTVAGELWRLPSNARKANESGPA